MTQHQGLLSEQGAAATSKGASRGSQWAVGDAWGKISLQSAGMASILGQSGCPGLGALKPVL